MHVCVCVSTFKEPFSFSSLFKPPKLCVRVPLFVSHTGERGGSDTIKASATFVMTPFSYLCVRVIELAVRVQFVLRPHLRQRRRFLRQQQAPPTRLGPSPFLCVGIKHDVVSRPLTHSLNTGGAELSIFTLSISWSMATTAGKN